MIVAVAIQDVMASFGINSLAEARDRFNAMAASDLPKADEGAFIHFVSLS